MSWTGRRVRRETPPCEPRATAWPAPPPSYERTSLRGLHQGAGREIQKVRRGARETRVGGGRYERMGGIPTNSNRDKSRGTYPRTASHPSRPTPRSSPPLPRCRHPRRSTPRAPSPRDALAAEQCRSHPRRFIDHFAEKKRMVLAFCVFYCVKSHTVQISLLHRVLHPPLATRNGRTTPRERITFGKQNFFHYNVGTRTAPGWESAGTWAFNPIAVEMWSLSRLSITLVSVMHHYAASGHAKPWHCWQIFSIPDRSLQKPLMFPR